MRRINIPVLQGQPLDGSGAVLIHLLIRSDKSLFTTPHALHPVIGEDGQTIKQQLQVGQARVQLACNPSRNPAGYIHKGIITAVPRTDDPRAVTCPKCCVSEHYQQIMTKLSPAGPHDSAPVKTQVSLDRSAKAQAAAVDKQET